ncbi:MAG: hypothetical protein ACLF0G_06725 [Candidatus Brocadiia bacterium]
MGRRWMAVWVVAFVLGMGIAWAEEAPAEAPAAERECYKHSLKRSLCTFSWQAKKRPWYQHVLWYVPSRVADLVDCVGIELGAGKGAHANVHATRLLQFAGGKEASTRVGLMGRYPVVVKQDLAETAAGWWWDLDLARETTWGAAPAVDLDAPGVCAEYHKAVDPAGIGVAVFPGVVGVSVELKLHEVLDFVKGFATIDSYGDDY